MSQGSDSGDDSPLVQLNPNTVADLARGLPCHRNNPFPDPRPIPTRSDTATTWRGRGLRLGAPTVALLGNLQQHAAAAAAGSAEQGHRALALQYHRERRTALLEFHSQHNFSPAPTPAGTRATTWFRGHPVLAITEQDQRDSFLLAAGIEPGTDEADAYLADPAHAVANQAATLTQVCSQLDRLRARSLLEQRQVKELTKRKASGQKARDAKRTKRASAAHCKSPAHVKRGDRSPSPPPTATVLRATAAAAKALKA